MGDAWRFLRRGTVWFDAGEDRSFVSLRSESRVKISGVPARVVGAALARLTGGRVEAFARVLVRAGVPREASHALLAELREAGVLGPRQTCRGWLSGRALTRVPGVTVRLGPLRRVDLDAGGVLLQLEGGRWRLAGRGGACRECAALEEVQRAGDAALAAEIANTPPHHAGIALSRDALARVLRATPVTGGWLSGGWDEAGSRTDQAHAFGCSVCPHPEPARRERESPKGVAEQALAVLRGAGLQTEHFRPTSLEGYRGSTPEAVRCTAAYRVARTGELTSYRTSSWSCGLTAHQRHIAPAVEAVERIASVFAPPTLWGVSPAKLNRRHLGVQACALYAPWQYRSKGFPCVPLTADLPIDWIRGTELPSGEALWVPSQLTHSFYGSAPTYVIQACNGRATHTDPDTAARGALLEVLERDALQRAWYGGDGAQTLDLGALALPRVDAVRRWMGRRGWILRLSHIEGRAGCHVLAAMAQRADGGALLGFGASWSLARAAEHAAAEALQLVEVPVRPPDLHGAPRWRDFWLLRMDELWRIQQLYLNPLMAPALELFFRGPPQRVRAKDRSDALPEVVARLRAARLRPIVIDLSSPLPGPFHTFHALIVGTQPPAFGMGVLRLGTGLLPVRPPPREPPLPTGPFRPRHRHELNPHPLPLV
jgi:ribosomal protein S12 methylthiotransferase accessory factor